VNAQCRAAARVLALTVMGKLLPRVTYYQDCFVKLSECVYRETLEKRVWLTSDDLIRCLYKGVFFFTCIYFF